MLYSSVPDVSVWPIRNTFLPLVFSMQATLALRRSRSLGCTVESSNAKYTVDSVHVASPPLDDAPALRHAPLTQSSSSAQSSFLLHALPASHRPALQLLPGPHSASVAQALHLPA